MTQEALSSAATLDRVIVVHIETGRNQASSYAVRESLARGFNLPIERLSEYLDGKIELAELLREAERTSADKAVADPRQAAVDLAREDGVNEAAIQSVLAEPVPEQRRSTLWWALRMRVREGELAGEQKSQRPATKAAKRSPKPKR